MSKKAASKKPKAKKKESATHVVIGSPGCRVTGEKVKK